MSLSDRILQKELCKSTYLGYWTPPEGEKEMTAEEVTKYEHSKIRAYLSPNPGFVRVVDGKTPLPDMPNLDYTENTEKPLKVITQRLKQFKENEEMSNLTEKTNTYTHFTPAALAFTESASAEKFLWKPTRIGCISSSQKMYAVEVNKTKMIVEDDGVKFAYNPDMPVALASDVVIPRIEDVQSINNKVVIVKFADGTSEKAVLSESDTFSLEQGVSICITKKILNKVLKGANGTSAYNKLVDYGLKVYDKKQKEIKEAIAAKKAEKEAEQKKIDRIRKKRAKRKAKLREEQIEIQAEAYRRAMKSE